MAQIKASHIRELPAENCLSIFIPHSKTDIFRDGNTTFLTDSGEKYSPVANRGVPEDLIMQHGRLKSTNSKNRYVKREVTQRLNVVKVLSGDLSIALRKIAYVIQM